MRVFVTGATGFIGKHVVSDLVKAGHQVTGITRKNEKTIGDLKLIKGDLTGDYSSYFLETDVFLHLAAAGVKPSSQSDWETCLQVNVIESLNIIKQAIENGVRGFVVCGSCFEYGSSAEEYDYIPTTASLKPTGAYHSSKAAATMLMMGLTKQYDLQTSLVRPFHTFGEGEDPNRFWPSLKAAALDGKDFPMSSGEQIRDFTPVKTVSSLIRSEVEKVSDYKRGECQVSNLGSGDPKSLRKFATEQWEKFGATGHLLLGAVEQRKNEVMRYVPQL